MKPQLKAMFLVISALALIAILDANACHADDSVARARCTESVLGIMSSVKVAKAKGHTEDRVIKTLLADGTEEAFAKAGFDKAILLGLVDEVYNGTGSQADHRLAFRAAVDACTIADTRGVQL
jgi:hypothetical protein